MYKSRNTQIVEAAINIGEIIGAETIKGGTSLDDLLGELCLSFTEDEMIEGLPALSLVER